MECPFRGLILGKHFELTDKCFICKERFEEFALCEKQFKIYCERQGMDNKEKVCSCKDCSKAVEVKGNVIGQWVAECRARPPVPCLIPTNSGMLVNALFPRVDSKGWCFDFEEKA